jgi:hypothetical protein
MDSKKGNDGQHRSSDMGSSVGSNNGQRTRDFDPRSRVGQPSGGEKNNGAVPAGRRDGDIATTTESAGPRGPSERRGGADDRK